MNSGTTMSANQNENVKVESDLLQEKTIPGSNWRASLEEELRTFNPEQSRSVSIYRVPMTMREVDPKAYTPNIVSIGPYHRGESRLQEMDKVKRKFFCRLIGECHRSTDGLELESVVDALESTEQEARSHYSEQVKLSSDEFVEMMLIDSCFIIELLREFEKDNFGGGYYDCLIEKWMLPYLRRDLIMLENQLPLFVVEKMFYLTSSSSRESKTSLHELALRFFAPLWQSPSMPRDCRLLPQTSLNKKETVCWICSNEESSKNDAIWCKRKHFLDLFRYSILPSSAIETESAEMETVLTAQDAIGGEETHMIHATELDKSGMTIDKGKNCVPLAIHSEARSLVIPPLYVDDYHGTLFRNLVAFEQRCNACKPQVTAYFFFLNSLVDSVDDVELLHRKGIIQHSLGCNKDVTDLINSVCKEVARAGQETYLQKAIWDANSFLNSSYATTVAPVLQYYFGSPVVRISTVVSLLLFFFSYMSSKDGFSSGEPDL